jgi:hypothetical protein
MSRIGDHAAPHPGWERIVPRYRLSRGVHPSPNSRHRLEPPFSFLSDNDCWQYGERTIRGGEEIQTTAWPHPTFTALNFSARKLLEFFNGAMKSRLPKSPWRDGRVYLEDGISGTLPGTPVTPRIQPTNLRPVA